LGIRQDTTKKGTTVTNKYQKNTPKTSSGPGLAIPDEVTIAMGEIAEDLREGLLALAVGAGLQVMAALMEADVAAVCGPRGKHDPGRSAVRHGRERGSVTLGGRRVGVDRPRMRATDGGEVPVAAYELFSRSEILGRMAMGRMLGGLSSRRYPLGLEPVGEKVERAASATSKSAVSRRFVAMTETALAELLAAPLGNLDLVALMIDGVHFGEHLFVVALGIGIDGTKHPLGLVEGSTENTTVVTELLTDLRGRGLDTTRPILVGIDGGKALHAAIMAVFDHPVVQRCQMHKLRNVADKLPDDLAAAVTKKMRAAYHAPSAIIAEAQLEALAREWSIPTPARPAACVKALSETLTVLRLGVSPTLARTLRSTNCIDDLHLPQPLSQREELAERKHGPALVRRRPGRGRQAVPPRQRPLAPSSPANRPRTACRRAECRCRPP